MVGSAIDSYDVIVVGGGHAGCEAALASARLGCKTALFTMNMDTIARMPCNPAIGGIGKGHLVKEIDALGGEMALAIDHTGIQFRRLNTRKGPAVQASRAQADRRQYHRYMRKVLEQTENLELRQGMITALEARDGSIKGVVCYPNLYYRAKAVVVTTGTFLNGLIHIGLDHYPAGRDGEFPAHGLSDWYQEMGFKIGRLKTGTPPRLDGRTIDFSSLQVQQGDIPIRPFSFISEPITREQVPCYITRTSSETHDIIRKSLDRSPLYSGVIQGIGPRYCPSIETKIVRFPDVPAHHIFLEPEGRDTVEVYANGISTSMPYDVQQAMVHSIAGLERARIIRPGYAIEYDFIPPSQLKRSLETKKISGLFHAGQINGTSGYEEAAAQGLLAGINAVRFLRGEPSIILSRDQAYIGVMIDDLCSQGVLEPYRMFTSRAEFRLYLREDNADERLTPQGRQIGLVTDERYKRFLARQKRFEEAREIINNTTLRPTEELNARLHAGGSKEIQEALPLQKLIARPDVSLKTIIQLLPNFPRLADEELQKIEYDYKYAGYVQRQREHYQYLQSMEHLRIPQKFNYTKVPGLNREIVERLNEVQPDTLAQAGRIPGMTPAALSVLLVYLKKKRAVVMSND